MKDYGKELEDMKVGDTILWPAAIAQVIKLMEGNEHYTFGEVSAELTMTVTKIS